MIKTPPEFKVLYEDQDVLVLDKPAGIVVNRAETNKQPSIQDWLATQLPIWATAQTKADWEELIPTDFSSQYGTPEAIFQDRLGIAHRLDKDTSGALLIAKNPGTLIQLLQQFRDRQIQKKYLCLVHGDFPVPTGEISAPLGRARGDRTKFAVQADGRIALTKYQVKRHFVGMAGLIEPAKIGLGVHDPKMVEFEARFLLLPPSARKLLRSNRATYDQGFSLVECEPKTGRTHQIRVHMTHIHHPIVGDGTYVGKKRAKLDSLWCQRQFLHAAELSFIQPRTKEKINILAQLPADLKLVLSRLIEA
jgi:23S rRNA pseudouridine1911/1915/1917 synthase